MPTQTDNLNLTLQDDGTEDWGAAERANFQKIDDFLNFMLTPTINTSTPSDSEVPSEGAVVDFLQKYGLSGNAVPRDPVSDLNSIAENRVVEINGGTVANTPNNSSRLWVETWVRAETTNDRYQIAWDANNGGRYERDCVGGPSNYSPWKRLLTEDDADAGFDQSLSTNGWCELPNGLIFQWGTDTRSGGYVSVSFPISFPSANLGVVAVGRRNASASSGASTQAFKVDRNSFNIGAGGNATGAYWIAIGY